LGIGREGERKGVKGWGRMGRGRKGWKGERMVGMGGKTQLGYLSWGPEFLVTPVSLRCTQMVNAVEWCGVT